MELWSLLGRIVLLLVAAALCGSAMRLLRQNVVVGYLLAGVLLGPTGFGLVGNSVELRDLSELGVALLLFTLGLEFSLARLRQIGPVATIGGSLQIIVTIAIIGGLALLFSSPVQEAVVLGCAAAMSSTAVVLRVLYDRVELDSQHGRNAIGMLLLQDLAVVPLLLTTEAVAEGAGGWAALQSFGIKIAAALALVLLLFLVMRYVMPRVLARAAASGSRELAVVIAVAAGLASAWGAHTLELSPALGAFVAGLLLAESPFAEQVRADATPLSAVFITIFFASVGTVAALPTGWALLTVLLTALALLAVKALVVGVIVWLFQRSIRVALLTAFALSQVGEFTFVLANVGLQQGLLRPERFQLLLGVSLVTLVLTPYIMALAPAMAVRLLRKLPVRFRRAIEVEPVHHEENRVVVIGYGPAGRRVTQELLDANVPFLVVDLNPQTIEANRCRFPIIMGDATQPEILQHVGVGRAAAVVVTVPDPRAARLVISQVRRLDPSIPIIARARYHEFAPQLASAGASVLVDEEEVVGDRLAEQVMQHLVPLAAQA